jgi:predicted MPP superfamily phosphohydrolase
VKDLTTEKSIQVVHNLTERQKDIILAGGLLNYTKQKNAEAAAAEVKPVKAPKAAAKAKKK